MTEKTQKYLSDVLLAIEAIEDFAKDIGTYSEYQQDAKSKSAIERQLIIIGEALNQIRKEDEVEITNTDEIVGFRNRLVHAYDHIDSNIVWLILKKHLPLLKKEVSKFHE
jgi:uncharacterized protein with HEPN domain